MLEKVKALSLASRSPIYAVDFDPQGEQLAICQQGDEAHSAHLYLWARSDSRLIANIESARLGEMITAARFSPDGKNLAFIESGSGLWLYDVRKQQRVNLKFDKLDSPIWLAYAEKKSRLAVAGSTILVWDFDTRQSIWKSAHQPLPSGSNPIPAIAALNATGTQIAVTGEEESHIVIYDLKTSQVVQKLEGATNHARCLYFHPHSHYLAAIDWYSRGAFLWNLSNGKLHLPKLLNATVEAFWCMRFDPTGKYLALGMLSGYVLVIRLEDGEILIDQRQHEGRVWDLAFGANGKQLVSAGDDGIAYVWDLT